MVNLKNRFIKYIFEKLYLLSRIARWQVLLTQYENVYMIRKTVIKNAITNHLVDNTIDDEESLNLDFYDEYVIILKTKKDNEESL